MDMYGFPTGGEARLIGLARGTDGFEYLITPEITQVVTVCFSARGRDELMNTLCGEVIKAKRQIVPNCFTCANPCGRTYPLDLSRLKDEPEGIRNWKRMLLGAARELVDCIRKPDQDCPLYQALMDIGIKEIDTEAMENLLQEIKTAISSCF